MGGFGNAAHKLEWAVGRLSLLMGFLAALCIIAITVSTLAEVFYRYFLGRSFLGVIELVEMLMAFIFFALMSYTQHLKGHLRLTLLTDRLPPKAQLGLDVFVLMLVLGFVTIMAWQAWDEAIISTQRRQIRFGAIEYPLWPGKIAAAAAVAVMCLQLLVDLLVRMAALTGREATVAPMGRPTSEADSV
jgi:TRAP-type transport system small permease protein